MKYSKVLTVTLVLAVLCLAVTSCVKLRRSAPEIHQYVLDAAPTGEKRDASADAPVLVVEQFSASPEYRDKGFVLRIDDWRVSEDYYNRWLVEPAQSLESLTMNWLSASGLFLLVLPDAPPTVEYSLLKGHLKRIYVDTRDQEVVLAVQYHLLDVAADGTKSLLASEEYEVRQPVSRMNPDDLADAWNKAAAAVMTQLREDLRQDME